MDRDATADTIGYDHRMPSEPRTALPTPIVIASIGCFWAFYFAIWSLRYAILHQSFQTAMLGTRAIVSLASAGLTVVFYLLMRRAPSRRLGRSIALALALAVPAAVLYSSFNWYMFSHLLDGEPMSWGWSSTAVASAGAALSPPASSAMTVGAVRPMADDVWSPLQTIFEQACNGYFFFIAWAALYLALGYAAEVGALERRSADLRAAAKAAELRALRYQVNPHFLFNTLNSLSSLVLAGRREQAEQMIINLATFFRTSLTGDPSEDVRLSEEIALQRLYLDIERVRFPDRLLFVADVPPAVVGLCVPGLILQPLIENAVKHAVAGSRRAVTIRVTAREDAGQLRIVVDDDGEPVGVSANEGTGLGLPNVRDRLAARFGDAANCRSGPNPGGGFAVTLTLPVVRDVC